MTDSKRSWVARISLPVKVGLVFALVAMILAVVGIIRGIVPANPLSIFLALLISGGSWGLVSWAVATAAVDVERDIAEQETGDPSRGKESDQGAANGEG